jgi:hypothetical protein
MLSTRFHDDLNVGGRAHATKTPGRVGAHLRKENPGGRGGAQTTLTGKGQERISNTSGYNDSSQCGECFSLPLYIATITLV